MTDNAGSTHEDRQERLQRSNRRMAIGVVCVAAGMVGLSYAAVPLYKIFCQVTGYEGTTQRVDEASDTVLDRKVRIRFVSYVSKDLDWEFEPVEPTADIRIGENKLAYYTAKNVSDKTLVGTARYKVMPEIVGSYFNKIECFCFTEQKLKPGESVKMPVSFFIDPEIVEEASANGIEEITLSYTFRPVRTEVSEAKEKTDKPDVKSADL